MNTLARIKMRSGRCLCAVLLICISLSAGAHEGGSDQASQLINFFAHESLRADNAARILTQRLELNPLNDELRSKYIEHPGDGLEVQRFQQYYKGICVEHGSFTMTSKNGIAAYAFGRFYPTSAVNGITPAIDEAAALSKAKAAVPAEKYAWESGYAEFPTGRLCLVEDFEKGDGDNMLHLSYAFDVYAEQPMARYMVYIDAHDGHVLFMNSLINHSGATGSSLYSGTVAFNAGLIGGQMVLHDSTRGSGIFTYSLNHQTNFALKTEVTSNTSVFASDAAVDAHWSAKINYDYWKNVRNRNSWNGADSPVVSYVHYDANYENAHWTGTAMLFGDGASNAKPHTTLDVCTHEFAHGVCRTTANLIYSRESGAMNESFSDIWGAVIETWGDPHEVDAKAKDRWLLGEERGAVRDFKNPKSYSFPDTYLGVYWENGSASCIPNATNDNCGVHYNSNVMNHWFYLLSEGGTGTNDLEHQFHVTGIGMTDAAKIVYASELTLNSTANFQSMRTASVAAANTIFGACSPQAEAVVRAWYAVGVGPDYPCTTQLSFVQGKYAATEKAGLDACRPTHSVSVPLTLEGPALSGDSATVNVIVIGGSAVQGTDYQLVNPTFSFQPGGLTAQPIHFLVYDNGVSAGNKYIDITYSLNARGSNASRSVYKDTTRVTLYENDYAPIAGSFGGQRTVLTNSYYPDTNASPFYGSMSGGHMQFIYKASELYAFGVRPGIPLTKLAFNVVSKVSTLPYYNFNLGVAQTGMNDFRNGMFTGSTTAVYSDSLTTKKGWTNIPFSTPFIWNGADNLLIEICFNNGTAYGANDVVTTQSGMAMLSAVNASNVSPGCTLPLSVINQSSRPVLQLTQTTIVETAKSSTRTWNLPANADAYFSSVGNEKLMAAILNPSDSLGCVTVEVIEDGNGFRPASGGSKRSLKEFRIQPATPSSNTNFDAILYVTDAELAGIDPGQIKIIQTTSLSDYALHPLNTHVITPKDVTFGTDYVGFHGSFTQFGRFYLSDGVPALSVNNSVAANSELRTGQNPFTGSPELHWTLPASEQVSIRLYDIAGRLVYGSEQKLESGAHQLMLSSPDDLAPGAYVLQVIRPGTVFTCQMMKR